MEKEKRTEEQAKLLDPDDNVLVSDDDEEENLQAKQNDIDESQKEQGRECKVA